MGWSSTVLSGTRALTDLLPQKSRMQMTLLCKHCKCCLLARVLTIHAYMVACWDTTALLAIVKDDTSIIRIIAPTSRGGRISVLYNVC